MMCDADRMLAQINERRFASVIDMVDRAWTPARGLFHQRCKSHDAQTQHFNSPARALGIFAAALVILATCLAVALGALLAPQTAWAGLRGPMIDFAAPRAAQTRAEGWAALSERV